MVKNYDFPNAIIKKCADGKYREFPKWCPCIAVVRPRAYVAEALRELRARAKGATA